MKRKRRDEDGKIQIDSPDEIPDFETEDELVAFWDTTPPRRLTSATTASLLMTRL